MHHAVLLGLRRRGPYLPRDRRLRWLVIELGWGNTLNMMIIVVWDAGV